MTVLETVVVLALCGYAFGFVTTDATLFDGIRKPLQLASVQAWRQWLTPDARHTLFGWLKVHALDGLLCPVCSGWWATGAAAVWLSTIVDLGGLRVWLPVTLAACGAQTAAHSLLRTGE